MPTNHNLPIATWPPDLTPTQIGQLNNLAVEYASHKGICYLPPHISSGEDPPKREAIRAPLSLFPSAIPSTLFTKVWELQKVYNILYSRIAMDVEFLDSIFGGDVQGIGDVDAFVGKMWKGWKEIRKHRKQPQIHLGLFRSDYLLHSIPSSDSLEIKQVEFNTISSALGPLGERVSAMHRYMASQTNNFFDVHPTVFSIPSVYPPNNASRGLAAGLASAHQYYTSHFSCSTKKAPKLLFVVQPNEWNIFDQSHFEHDLFSQHGLRIIRRTLKELSTMISLVQTDMTDPILEVQGDEISVIYFRAGYSPKDYASENEWQVRFDIDTSRAIPCPTLPLHLAGSKKIQEVLTRQGVVERFLLPSTPTTPHHVTGQMINSLRQTWVKMWDLSSTVESGENVVDFLLSNNHFERMVLKPQREGGGNNIYGDAIPSFLASLPTEERKAWIVMELIQVPKHVCGYFVPSSCGEGEVVKKEEVASELGIFGWSLFGKEQVLQEGTAGYVVRTKDARSEEGGFARGLSVLDSLILV